jgi:hypothetical protein
MDAPALVSVRFLTARAALCGVHYSGVEYAIPREFARQVVEIEHAAEYVHDVHAAILVANTGPLTKKKR